MLKITLTGYEDDLIDAWQQYCGDLPNVTIYRGSILDLSVDAIVSPANSFGFMDGGIDRIYTRYFGRGVQDRLQQLIRSRHNGELLVGAAEIVATENEQIPYIIAAPTMRVPTILTDTVNPYLAARAALLLVKNGSRVISQNLPISLVEPVSDLVSSIAFPGLGTGVGRVDPNICARQVRTAIDEVILDNYRYPNTWAEAQRRHQLLYSDSVRDLQMDD